MSNTITELILNFKETLMNNYYGKTNEKDKFLEWLESNISYTNGSYSILEEQNNNTISSSEVHLGENNRLKNLVGSWSRDKLEKQEYWNNLLKSRLSYLNGTFSFDKVNDKYVKQDVTGTFTYETYYNGKHYYRIVINVSPAVSGQNVRFSPDFNVYRSVKNGVSQYIIDVSSDTIINSPVTLIVESFLGDNNVVYSGGSITVDPLTT